MYLMKKYMVVQSHIILLMQKNVDRDGWMTTNTAREKFKRVFLCV